ncbi:FYVE, RhoGEF and PH domain-containing protein 4-like isoform X2 [Mya arenaria]|uniref:FYVE, RhoGEF and PH domain-containing protein 4-like isoform X2 n=1 Tax=Mya arenaria TaxID=6604 RepID=UPI0022E1813A|nr:FYVE, RhoGEF and PH domain-containing protein 4-like isoform X2 [Mya arenaria]
MYKKLKERVRKGSIKDENDGFPLPSTPDDLKEFDRQAFIETPEFAEKVGTKKSRKKRDRQRSKSATNVPDLGTIRLKLQKLHSPGKPKFLEHLLSRVVSRKAGKSRDGNGLVTDAEESIELPAEPLSPDSEKCLQHAEAIVEELLACAARPPSGDSSDSGKGSLFESTSDFSPTGTKRKAWSTPASPTFQGIVKERLKNFQALTETSDTESVNSNSAVAGTPVSPKAKIYKNEEYVEEIKEINKNIKAFYTSISEDESFNSAIMESGYVKALVAKINHHKLPEEDHEEQTEDTTEDVDVNGEIIVPVEFLIGKEDSGWSEWEEEVSPSPDDEEGPGENGINRKPSVHNANDFDVRSKTSTPTLSARNSSCSSTSTTQYSVTSANSDSESQEEDEKPRDKLHQIAYELLTTERAYVSRLHLLDQVFHARVMSENQKSLFMPNEAISQIFSKITPIYCFHKEHLLPQLEDRMKHWQSIQRVGDVMAKLAPFLLLYTECVKNYDKALATIAKWTAQSQKFASLLQEIQMLPDCAALTLQHHMLEPIQRVPRYELLLKQYIKHLGPDAEDRKDAQKALDLVTQAACHSNTVMKKLDKFHKLLTIIPKLNGEGTSDLVNPTRELIKEGAITKISARSGEKQARYIFLFNDLLLVCSEQMLGSYRIRSRLSVDGMEVNPGENITISGTFCVKCIEKSIEFLDESNNGNGSDWFSVFQQVISDYQKKSRLNRLRSTESASESEFSGSGQFDKSKLGQQAPVWIKDEEVTMCMSCTEKFTRLRRRHHCRACGKVYCGKCTSDRAYLEYEKMRDRVCRQCLNILQGMETEKKKQTVKDVDPEKDSLMSSYVNIMDKDRKWFRRWATAHSDFVIYIYKKHKDPQAIQTIPLPGHIVKMVEIPDKKHVFALTHKDAVVCHIQAETEEELQQWMSILGKLVLLEIPESRPNRVSTHSDSSGQSTQSSNSSDQSSQL